MSSKQRISNPAFWVPSVYFGMGLPFVAISVASVLMFTNMGISDSKIAFWTSLVMIPWTLKPLWSGFLEMFKTKKFFVVFTEILSGVLFGLIALSLPLPSFFTYSIALMGILAFSGATHDIAGDGVYLAFLDKKQQAQYIGWQGASYNIAKILTSGGLVYIAGSLESSVGVVEAWMVIMFICALIMLALGMYHIRILPTEDNSERKVSTARDAIIALWEVIRTFFQKKYIGFHIIFIILYRSAEGLAVKIVPLFLKACRDVGGLGLSTQDIGLVYGTAGSAAFVVGSILGGYFISSVGLKKSLIYLWSAFNIPFVGYFLLAAFRPDSLFVIGLAVVIEYFGYGFGFVGLMLFMMQQIAPGKHQMAHYAFATAIMNLGFMLPSMVSGTLSDLMGYKTFFIIVLIATIPAFLVTVFVPFVDPDSKDKVVKAK